MIHVSEGTDEAVTPEWFVLRRMLHAIEQANWQRGQGKGDRPKVIPTPSEAFAAARKKGSRKGVRNAAMERQIARAKAAKRQQTKREGRSADGY